MKTLMAALLLCAVFCSGCRSQQAEMTAAPEPVAEPVTQEMAGPFKLGAADVEDIVARRMSISQITKAHGINATEVELLMYESEEMPDSFYVISADKKTGQIVIICPTTTEQPPIYMYMPDAAE